MTRETAEMAAVSMRKTRVPRCTNWNSFCRSSVRSGSDQPRSAPKANTTPGELGSAKLARAVDAVMRQHQRRKADFRRILRDHPQFAQAMITVGRERYDLAVSSAELLGEPPAS